MSKAIADHAITENSGCILPTIPRGRNAYFASPSDIIGLTDGYAKIGSTRWPVSAVTSVDALRTHGLCSRNVFRLGRGRRNGPAV